MTTTTFYHPETTKKLQASGVYLLYAGRHYREMILVGPDGETYLRGNIHWLKSMCEKYELTFSVKGWFLLSQEPPGPSSLYQTEFGARTLPDALYMLELRKSLPDVTQPTQSALVYDNYNRQEDTLIDREVFFSSHRATL